MSLLLTLAGISGETWSEEITSEPKVLGRAEGVDVRLDHHSVSRQHCRLWLEGDQSYIEDCGSTNGTLVNGVKIQREKLFAGDTILIGRFELIVEDSTLAQQTVNFPEESEPTVEFDDPQDELRYLAATIQRRLTPNRQITLPGLTIEVAYSPCGHLGGDSFEFFRLKDRCVLIVLDPMCHGIKAALAGSLLRTELERWIELTPEPARCLQSVNHELLQLGVRDLYFSAIVASWFPRTQTLVFATSGVHPPLLLREHRVQTLGDEAGGMPLGIANAEGYVEQLMQLKPADRFFLFTDGVAEAVRPAGPEEKAMAAIQRVLEQHAALPMNEQVRQIAAACEHATSDDVLFVGIEVAAS
jgi:serine phosphatase RsbU (regulator of sigma subunit)